MLPPKFPHKDAHHYGTFRLTFTPALTTRNNIIKVETFFFGSHKKIVQPCDSHHTAIFNFNIATNLWHFYAYLSDCRHIPLFLTDSQNETYSCEVPLVLMPSSQVLNKLNKNIDYLFANNSYLLEGNQKIRILDDKRKAVGCVEVAMDLKFDEGINRVLLDAGMVNMEDLLIIDEISPIPSAIELENISQRREAQQQIQTKVALEKSAFQFDKHKEQKDDRYRQTLPIFERENVRAQLPQLEKDKLFEQDQKMIEDDIDRLIAEMQNRPYDSTRYLQSQIAAEKKQNINFANTSPLLSQTKSSYQQSIPPKHPCSTKPMSSRNGVSPIRTAPIYSYSVANHADPDRVNYLINKTTLTSREFKRSVEKMSESREKNEVSTQKGTIRLKIHQLMMQRYEEDVSLILKCYLNDGSDEYYTANGIKQGETISFSSNMLINEKRQIHLLRFVLIDSFDMKSIYAQGEFEMERLLSLKPTKGVFTVNMRSISNNNNNQRNSSREKVVTIDESKLSKVLPNMKTLRIELEYEQQIEIVQIYLNLSNFSKTIRTCRYKIPMTKETIEFRISELQHGKHVNIFPHNRSSQSRGQDKIIVELWNGEQLVGINEINLKALQSTNQRIIMSSLEPIYLYDQLRNIESIKESKTNNNFYLQLYYGTISQVQSLLNQAHRKQPKQQPMMKQVEVEERLGVYVKQRKQQRQVEIQVGEHEVVDETNMIEKHLSKKSSLGLQQQEDLPDQQQEQGQEKYDGKEEQMANEFLNRSLQQKYLNKQTLPIFTQPPANNQNHDFKKTQQVTAQQTKSTKIVLRSLTEEYQQLIKQNLADLSNEQSLRQLKSMVKEHLLYNFIEIDRLRLILQELGVQRKTTNVLLEDIIGHSNNMLNINVLYDMIYGLMLDGGVKQKYLDDAQVGKYCLAQLYINLHERGDGQESSTLFDENVQYDEGKKMYQAVGYRLSMREYNQIQIYIKKMRENFKMDCRWMRDSLLSRSKACERQQHEKEEYKQQVIQKIYHHAQWDEDDDFFISNINHSQPQLSVITNKNTSQTNRSYQSDLQNQTPTAAKVENTPYKAENTPYKAENIPYNSSIIAQKPVIETQLFIKKPQANLPPSSHKQPTMKMTIQGFQNCIETTQCHLNITLTTPQLKLIYKNNTHENSMLLGREQTSCDLHVHGQEQYLDGSVQLLNEGRVVARCNFSMIADVRSVYTLKSTQQAQFCGLLYLRFRAL